MKFLNSSADGAEVEGSRALDESTGTPAQAVAKDALQEDPVGNACPLSRLGKVLVVSDLRVGVGFQDIDRSVRVEPEVNACVAAESKDAIDALRNVLDLPRHPVRKLFRLTRLDAVLGLILTAPLDPLGGNAAALLWHLVHAQLPDGQDLQVQIPQDAHVEFTAFDVPL